MGISRGCREAGDSGSPQALYPRSGRTDSDLDTEREKTTCPGPGQCASHPPARDWYLILQIFCQQAVKKNHLHKIKHTYR